MRPLFRRPEPKKPESKQGFDARRNLGAPPPKPKPEAPPRSARSISVEIKTSAVSEAHRIRQRLGEILARHVSAEDKNLTDDALVRIVFERYEKERAAPLIDPNE